MPGLPAGATVVVAGLGVSGRAALAALRRHGHRVVTVDARAEDADASDAAAFVADGGLDGVAALVVSPGWPPHGPLPVAALAAGLPVWSEVELAWRLRVPRADGGEPAPWLAVTGTNGKTTTVGMLAAILTAAGRRTAAVGNVGTPVVEAVEDPSLDVLAVELSSFQLHFTHSMSAQAAAVLNVAADHLDWHGDLAAYAADKGRVFERAQVACVYNLHDRRTEDLVRGADVVDGALAVGFTLATPGVGQVGLVEDVLVDRGFARLRHTHAAELGTLADLAHLAGPDGGVPPHVVQDALAAAALALAHGVEPVAVRDGLRAYAPGAHRIEEVARADGIAWVDDSKATNAHAASASLAAFEPGSVVWVAGGLAKGATFDELVRARADRLHAAVLIGVDRAPLRDALARHAPQVPVVEIDAGDTGDVMTRAVQVARRLAQPAVGAHDPVTVLLAPASASMDQFRSYAERGAAFAAAARAVAGGAGTAASTGTDPGTDPGTNPGTTGATGSAR
ncbi:UDP-N-acetylmuramoyl-L-alanine--D-glutamate ligase [Cellulomonas endophytica]|uniref:UDP-N-acetylmuramoyl-L-alanine--D-glutamate ligase n=1 Tax=Cellulomonas endophytica TaxID=2494735 RepID=UPI001013489B|nr:UDP-N-acetylmuramoyl-L-alanine--D-glutamate ligase [Cellulomonas endophytica]